jgi:hypothetical protein
MAILARAHARARTSRATPGGWGQRGSERVGCLPQPAPFSRGPSSGSLTSRRQLSALSLLLRRANENESPIKSEIPRRVPLRREKERDPRGGGRAREEPRVNKTSGRRRAILDSCATPGLLQKCRTCVRTHFCSLMVYMEERPRRKDADGE